MLGTSPALITDRLHPPPLPPRLVPLTDISSLSPTTGLFPWRCFVCLALQRFWKEKAKEQPPAVLQADKGSGSLLPLLQLNKGSTEPRAGSRCNNLGMGKRGANGAVQCVGKVP